MFGLKFRRQVPIGSYIVDFYCEELKLVLEVDGEVHNDPNQARSDEVRDIHLRQLGFQVLCVPNGMVLKAKDVFAEEIRRFVK
jgi:uroporphyrinogen-III synthase